MVAKKLGLKSWHELITDDELTRLGLEPSAPLESPDGIVSVVKKLRSLHQLPAPVSDFTGRKGEIEQLVGRLRDGCGVTAICGMGGVGKTTLAKKVAEAVKDRYPDAQLFLDLRGMSDQPMTAVEAMARVVGAFHPDAGKLPDTEDELKPVYLSVLDGRRTLLVLDNAKDEKQVEPLLVAHAHAGFLVTSRIVLALDEVDEDGLVLLDALPAPDAEALLRGIVKDKGTDDELRAVAELCGRLPLALRVAGVFLHLHPTWSVQRYIEALTDENTRLERLGRKPGQRDVEPVLALSARQLVAEDTELAKYWQMLSIFPGTFVDLAAKSVCGFEAADEDLWYFTGPLAKLLNRSLIQTGENARRYELHDLLRPIARHVFRYAPDAEADNATRDRLTEAMTRFAEWMYAWMSALDVGSEVGWDTSDRWPGIWAMFKLLRKKNNTQDLIRIGFLRSEHLYGIYRLELHNIRTAYDWVFEHRQDNEMLADLCRKYAALEGSGAFDMLYTPDVRTKWWQRALDVARENKDQRTEVHALCKLGAVHASHGSPREAIALSEQGLALARSLDDPASESLAVGNLALANRRLGYLRTAVAYHERQLHLARERRDRKAEAQALGGLALACAETEEKSRAIDLCQDYLKLIREGGNAYDESHALFQIALVLALCDLTERAISLAESALSTMEQFGDPTADVVRRRLARWRKGGSSS